MATWKNLDTLASYSKLAELKSHVNTSGPKARERIAPPTPETEE